MTSDWFLLTISPRLSVKCLFSFSISCLETKASKRKNKLKGESEEITFFALKSRFSSANRIEMC
jgi:hypothetical protein